MIKLLHNDYGIFGSFDIRNNFITNLKKHPEIPIDKACAYCGINYVKFYKSYLDNPHPVPGEVFGACFEYQFKNLLKLYGVDVSYMVKVAGKLTEDQIKEINDVIGTRIKENRTTGRPRG